MYRSGESSKWSKLQTEKRSFLLNVWLCLRTGEPRIKPTTSGSRDDLSTSVCQSVVVQDTKPQVAPGGQAFLLWDRKISDLWKQIKDPHLWMLKQTE